MSSTERNQQQKLSNKQLDRRESLKAIGTITGAGILLMSGCQDSAIDTTATPPSAVPTLPTSIPPSPGHELTQTQSSETTQTPTATPETPTPESKIKVEILKETIMTWEQLWEDGGRAPMSERLRKVPLTEGNEGGVAYFIEENASPDDGSTNAFSATTDINNRSLWWAGARVEKITSVNNETEYFLRLLVFQGPTSANSQPFLYQVHLPMSQLFIATQKDSAVRNEEDLARFWSTFVRPDGVVKRGLASHMVVKRCELLRNEVAQETCRHKLNLYANQMPNSLEEFRDSFLQVWQDASDLSLYVGTETIREYLNSKPEWWNDEGVPIFPGNPQMITAVSVY